MAAGVARTQGKAVRVERAVPHFMGVPEGEEKKQEIENLFEKIMKAYFPNLARKYTSKKSRKLRQSQRS